MIGIILAAAVTQAANGLPPPILDMPNTWEKLTAACFKGGWDAARADMMPLSDPRRKAVDAGIRTIKKACNVP